LKHGVKTAALSVLCHGGSLRNGLLHAAAARGRCLVLCYHRVAPDSDRHQAVEPIPPQRFAEQMRALTSAGDIVPLRTMLSFCRPYERPTFAVTFDDDDPSHVRYALPILRELGIPATFFLSGRALHGLGPYWWALLEQSVEEIGLEATSRLLGHSRGSVKELARACRHAGTVKELSPKLTPPVMEADDVRTLAQAGMTIGFHTVRHPALPVLNDADLDRALTEGRDALASAAGAAVELLAYPYGRADARVTRAARRAGYTAAFATGNRPMTRHSHRFLIGRWQPGPLNAQDLLAEAALRLTIPEDRAEATIQRRRGGVDVSLRSGPCRFADRSADWADES
jgi:peptidoglycan/xylan/chitin deacetylase (PgdA/CDA1 family)